MEAQILLFIQDNIRNGILTPILKIITSMGNAGIFWIVLTLALLCFKKTRTAGLCSAIAMLISFGLNNLLLKNLIARQRPYEVIEGLTILVKEEHDLSFPSGHAATAFASVIAMYRLLPKKASIAFLVLAVLISLSRLYVGVHYPTDVLAGIILGSICGLIGAWAGLKIAERINSKKQEKAS